MTDCKHGAPWKIELSGTGIFSHTFNPNLKVNFCSNCNEAQFVVSKSGNDFIMSFKASIRRKEG